MRLQNHNPQILFKSWKVLHVKKSTRLADSYRWAYTALNGPRSSFPQRRDRLHCTHPRAELSWKDNADLSSHRRASSSSSVSHFPPPRPHFLNICVNKCHEEGTGPLKSPPQNYDSHGVCVTEHLSEDYANHFRQTSAEICLRFSSGDFTVIK